MKLSSLIAGAMSAIPGSRACRRGRLRRRELLHQLRLQQFALDEHAIVAITDPHGVITFANDKFCELSKYEREELIGQTHAIINSGQHPKSLFVEMWTAISAGRTWRGEICNRAKDGSLYWVDTSIVPFKDARGVITQHVAIRADITERKRAELRLAQSNQDLARANAELQRFTYIVSHDLKSPILTVQGYLGFLRRDLHDERYDRLEEFVEHIDTASVRMRETIDDLLELSRVGRVSHDADRVDVAKLASDLIREMDVQIAHAGAEVSVEGEIPAVWGDRLRVIQAIENLLANALKYACAGERIPRITIRGTRVGDGVHLSVADNGPGVPAEHREKVFGLFERLETGVDGTGIGLAIVRRIAEVHGGRVWIETTPGGGATFLIALPADTSDTRVWAAA